MYRKEIYTNGQVVERIEVDDIGNDVEYRRYDGSGRLLEQREATTDEASVLVADQELATVDAANTRIVKAYEVLQQWAADQAAINNAWPTLTNAQKDGANRQLQRRFGLVCENLADLLIVLEKKI